MKKIKFALSLILMMSLCLGILSSCVKDHGESGSTDGVTAAPTESLTDSPTDAPTDSLTEAPTDEPTEAPTDKPDEPVDPEMKELLLGWNYGYVGSSSNSSYTNVFNPSGKYYSTSDIICIEKAGTVITFVDDNTGSNGDANFASKSAYVISSWKKDGDNWTLDTSATNIPGAGNASNEVAAFADGKVTYTYTTTKDNENIRLCYRSGATDSFVPTYPTVTYKTSGKISTEKANSNGSTDVDPSGKTEVTVLWHLGYVGSSSNSGSKNKLNDGAGFYSYTDVFTVAKAGTRITFVDNNTNSNGDTNFASNAAYVVSSWKKDGENWVIDLDGANIPGSGSAKSVIANPENGAVTYSYVTSKDNENLRLCFRSGEKTSFKPAAYPKVYAEYTGETGTLAGVMATDESIKEFLDESKKKTNYTSLEGITMNVIGDSYFAGDSLDSKYVWPSLLAQKYNMKFQNYGKNGGTISNYVTTNNPMVSRYGEMANNDPDIVIIEGGKNDYNKSVPIGADGSTKTTDFKGAVRTVIEGVKKKYPNALVICVTVWNVGGNSNSQGKYVKDYGDAMIAVCRDMGVPCFNAMDTSVCPVDMTSSSFRTKYCMKPTDVSHLNIEGHKLVLPAFEKFIADSYNSFLAAK